MKPATLASWLSALLWAFLLPAAARAGDEADIQACIEQAAATFQVDALPLTLLRQVEAGTLGANSAPNSNGSYDIGPMQINSSWLPRLARIGISEPMLRDDACINVHVAAWIYKQELRATGDPAMAMARYHSPTARHQARYLGLVRKAIQRKLVELGRRAAPERALAGTP